MIDYENKLEIVKDYWVVMSSMSEDYKQQISWIDYPLIQREYINKRYSEFTNSNWLNYIKKKYSLNNLSKGLSLGCGVGGLERHAIGINICKHFDAYDFSDESIKVAKKYSDELGFSKIINYKICDVNKIILEENKYDVVFACMSAHHFSSLEWIFEQVKISLKSGGLFILNEYVGPNQFQWTDEQLDIANKLLEIIPLKYRKSISTPGVYKNQIIRYTIEQMNLIDPSEAIRSEDILGCLKNLFSIIEIDCYGGTILHLLLHDIVGNFNMNLEYDCAILRLLCEYEKKLIEYSILPSDFMLLVAKNVK